MLKSINRFLNNDEFSLNIWNNNVCINNFIDIISLDDDSIIVSYLNGLIRIQGKDLLIKRLSNHEILISGSINIIKMGDLDV